MKYTVILMRPDYATDNFGNDAVLIAVDAKSPREALAEARALVLEADDNAQAEPADYYCIAVIEGEHVNLNPE